MQNCPLQLNTSTLWHCPDCGWTYSKRSDKPPRRNCPASRTPEAIGEKIRAVMAQHRTGEISLVTFYAESDKLNKQWQKAKEDEADAEKQQTQAQHGPGAHLHRLIEKYSGEGITASCACKSRIAEMNRRGRDWCRENIETIIDWLIEEVERRLKAAESDDRPARWRLRLGGLDVPGRRFAMRQLILVAVRRAERKLLSNPQ